MRLHRLEVSAFGPYRGHETVDFDALSADGLFLLHGDTGAGKTTLLDAVAFALYGSVPGVRGQAKRLRCDTASPDVPTRVELELTVQGHRLRVERSPEYQRPKKRGDGFTTQPAKAALTWVERPPSGEPAEGLTRIDEVGRTVQRLLGMSVDQFFQVVLLPQGEFARFLRAETNEREELLERLFGTRRFAQVEQWFRQRRKERGAALQEQGQYVRELVARVSQVAGVEADSGADDQEWLRQLEKQLDVDAEQTTAEWQRLGKERDAAEAELAARRELADKARRVREANAELADLEARRTQHQGWQDEVDAARRAVPVLTVREGVRAAERECERAAEELRLAKAAFTDLDPNGELADLRRLAADKREEAGALQQLVVQAQQQDVDQRRLGELERAIEADEAADSAIADRLEGLPEQITAAREQIDEAREAGARLETVTARVTELRSAAEVARELPAAEERRSNADQRLRDAVDAHQRARDALLDVRSRRLAGMAAELAGGLTSGESCPVCGSVEHPRPAEPIGDPITGEDEDRAQADEQAAHAAREQAAAAAQQELRECERLRQLLGERTEETLAAELAECTAERDRLQATAAQLDHLRDRLSELERSAEQLAAQREELRTRVAGHHSEYSTLVTVVTERHERLEQARGEHASVAERRQQLLDTAARTERLVAARTAADEARRRVDDQRAVLRQSARQAGFGDVEEAIAAERSEQHLEELGAALADVQQRTAAARATLASPELFGVTPDIEVDVDAAAEAAKTARDAAEQAAASARSAEQRRTDVAQLAKRLREAWARLGPAQADFAELDALTDLVNGRGQNARKISLRSYVLAARLEEVAVAATRRLQRMSDGRYSFVHSDAAGAHGTRGGLGLDVLDDYSGKVRPTKTLSGGESFLASLSLALGLADVVAAETGGTVLDTMFIDEGFGTLDSDTLELVMDTLDDLRAGGRIIGLVSHIEEVRQRIPVRLRVRKSRSGSTMDIQAA